MRMRWAAPSCLTFALQRGTCLLQAWHGMPAGSQWGCCWQCHTCLYGDCICYTCL